MMAVAAMLMLVLAASPAHAGYASVQGPMILGVGDLAQFELEVDSGVTADYVASLRDSRNQSMGGISASSGQVEGSKTLDVTMPSSPGDYVLLVTFTFDDGSVRQKDWPVRVVEPYVLKAQVRNEGPMALEGLKVSFLVDGALVGSEVVDLDADSVLDVEHRWVTLPLAEGEHRLEVRIDSDDAFVNLYSGGKSHVSVFHIGQKDYGGINWAMGIALLILVLALVWVYRKPVRNLGRPRGRRR